MVKGKKHMHFQQPTAPQPLKMGQKVRWDSWSSWAEQAPCHLKIEKKKPGSWEKMPQRGPISHLKSEFNVQLIYHLILVIYLKPDF
jgi:hypothetical protein